eukprot:4884605-Pyramimonas_sp.AAC.1
MGAVPPCERSHWSFRWRSLWGHDACEGCADMVAVPPRGRSHGGTRWSSLCEGCAAMRTQPLGPSLPMGPRSV